VSAVQPGRVALLCEVLRPPLDEGIRIIAANMAREIGARVDLMAAGETDAQVEGVGVQGVLGNRWFISSRLRDSLRRFGPEAILYVPWTSMTPRTLIRCAVLKRYVPRATVAVLACQPRAVGAAMRLSRRIGAPDRVLALGPGAESQAAALDIPAERIDAGVDAGRFRPASPEQRLALRRRAGIDPGAHVVLHVGHLKASRNVGVLEEIARMDGFVAILVASSSTRTERDLAARLAGAGAVVMTHHQDRIEFAYQMADTYIFPVLSPLDAIEQPLSVLEAAACGLNIVSTPYGGLPDLLWGGGDTILWEAVPERFAGRIARLLEGSERRAARRLVEGLTWSRAAGRVLEALAAAGKA